MKAVLAAIVLLCLSTTVLAHDIYTNLRDRDARLCCNGQDCKPVQATVLPDGNYYLPESGETIPADMATPSPPAEKATEFPWDRPQLSVVLMALRLRTLHRAKNIGSALKAGVDICQRQRVNKVLGFLVTEFVCDFGGEDATPIQLGFHPRGLLDHI